MVVAALVEREGRYLLVEERVESRLVLNQPAGHWEAGETLLEACVREALEETGWDVEPEHLLGLYEHQPPELDYCFLRVAFAARALRHHPERPLDSGIERALWMTREEIAACPERHRSPMVLRCVDDLRSGRRLPLDAIAHLTPRP